MKINEKNLAAFASSALQVDREGYLMKRSEGQRSFAKRWFVLKGNLLFYFDKKLDKEPSGVIILEGSTIELAETEMEEHFCFKIVFPSRSYLLSAESHQSMEQWMKSLACASYDYVKLMAAELQRQLSDLNDSQGCEATSLLNSSYHHIAYQGAADISSSGSYKSDKNSANHVPTPPPRAKNPKNHGRKTFETLHKEFGAKIMRDQVARWALSENPQHLSVHQKSSLIDV